MTYPKTPEEAEHQGVFEGGSQAARASRPGGGGISDPADLLSEVVTWVEWNGCR